MIATAQVEELGCRIATADDESLIERLVASFLLDRDASGSDVVANDKSIGFNMSVLRSVVSGEVDGVVVLAGDYGLDAATDAFLPWDSRFGRVATSCLTYVSPEMRNSGVATRLRLATGRALRKMGFDALIASVDLSNKQGISSAEKVGDIPYQLNCVRFLDREN